jgi:hypothetical protein
MKQQFISRCRQKSVLVVFWFMVVCQLFYPNSYLLASRDSSNMRDYVSIVEIHEPTVLPSKLKTSSNALDRLQQVDEKLWMSNTNQEGDDLAGMVNGIATDYAGNPKVNEANKAFGALMDKKLLEKLTGNELVELPVGLSKTIAGNKYTVLINKARLFPGYIELEIFCKIKFPDNKFLLFGSDNVKYSNEGGFFGDVRLGLYADFAMFQGSSKMAVILKKYQPDPRGNDGGTYVVIDCEGFKELRVDARFLLSRDWVLPTDPMGNILQGNERVKADFAVTVQSWDELIIEASVSPFALTKMPQVAFMVNRLVVDMSDTRDAPGFVPPPSFEGISQNGVSNAGVSAAGMLPISDGDSGEGTQDDPGLQAASTWKGLFIKTFEIIFPKEFNKGGSYERLSAGVENLYIDSRGVTGSFFIENALPMGAVNVGKWPMSVDQFRIDLVYSRVTRFVFNGRIQLSVNERDRPMTYTASANIQKSIYMMQLDFNQSTSFPLLGVTEVTIHPGSAIKIEVNEGKFEAIASLNGRLSANASEGSDKSIGLPSVTFRKLLIMSKAPFLDLARGGSLTLDQGGILNNSFINVNACQLYRSSDTEIMLGLQMSANLMGGDDGGANTSGTFGIKAKMVENGEEQRWQFNGIKLTSLTVEIVVGKHLKINGTIGAVNDEVYGQGFVGELSGGFIAEGTGYKVNVAARVRFGTMHKDTEEEYKYWFFDVFVDADKIAIPLFAGVEMNGFGGGAYHHMKMQGGSQMDPAAEYPSSGIMYVPDKNTRLGLKATMAIRAKGGAIKGVVTFEMEFGANMQLNQILFYGSGTMVSDIKVPDISQRLNSLGKSRSEARAIDSLQVSQSMSSEIKAAFFFSLNFEEGFEMHGSFSATVNVGEGAIQGQATVDLLISPNRNKWHLYLGAYSDYSVIDINDIPIPPISATIRMGPIQVNATAYFMTGNDIPGPPPVPQPVAAFFGLPVNSNNREILNTGGRSPATGSGFALGAAILLDIQRGEGKCRPKLFKPKDIPVHISIIGGAGFDLSLLYYDGNTSCSLSNTSPHGLGGWRAGGRVWSFLEVRNSRWSLLGLCVPLPTIGVGVLLDGDVPNPSYFQAAVQFRIVGINIKFRAELGRQCGTIVNN